jgi:tRNA nucleotidyltransferase (CCA-adding enzyme)
VKIYLVGGAVRDQLLGLPIHERDYVVVGATPEDLSSQGFKSVGQFFPVFLHPDTKEEYALARLERKTALGHQGFQFDFSPKVTLEEDLIRRDLTINAMAQSDDGVVIDPYQGLNDLKQKKLRHVSQAFAEDPLRVFRVARFYARFFYLGFSIDPSTLSLMQSMKDELSSLSAERIWGELQKAIVTKNPEAFFECLHDADCLETWFPKLSLLKDPDFENVLTAIKQLPESFDDFEGRAAYVLYCISEREKSPVRWPNRVLELCACLEKYLEFVKTHLVLTAELMMNLFEKVDAIRQPPRFLQMLEIVDAVFSNNKVFAKERWEQILLTVISVSAQTFVDDGLKGSEIGVAVRKKRLQVLENLI